MKSSSPELSVKEATRHRLLLLSAVLCVADSMCNHVYVCARTHHSARVHAPRRQSYIEG